MAEIDTSFYKPGARTEDDPNEITRGLETGMKMSQFMRQKQEQDRADKFREEAAWQMRQGPDGKMQMAEGGMRGLAQIDPEKAFAMQQQMQQAQHAELQNKKMTGDMAWEDKKRGWEDAQHKVNESWRILGGVHDQSSWEKGLEQAKAVGIDVSQYPQQYSPQLHRQLAMNTLDAKANLEQMNKEREFDLKKQEIGTKHEENKLKREELGLVKTDKMAQEFGKHLDQGWAGRSGQAGQVQGKLNAAEYAQGLIEQGKSQQGGLDSRQIEELAQSTARLLGGTAAASARVEALVPHTAWGKAQSFKEWISNQPQGAEMQAFTDRLAETVQREKDIAEKQKRRFQVEGLPDHSEFKRRDAKRYEEMLKSRGITPDMIDKNGRYKEPGAGQSSHPQDSEAILWAKQNPKDPMAVKILQMNGVQ